MTDKYSDQDIEDIKNTENLKTKMNFVIDRLDDLEDTVQANGLTTDVTLNSWFRRISIVIYTGLAVWIITNFF